MSMDQNRIDALGRMIAETARKQEMTAAAQTPRTEEDVFDIHGRPGSGCPNCAELQRELAAAIEERDTTATDLRDELAAAKAEADHQIAISEHCAATLLKVRVALTGDLHGSQDLVAEAEALREKLHNISNEFPAVYQRGLRDGIKQGMLRAAEICDDHDSGDDQGYGAWKAAAAIRAEAEK